MNKIKGQIMQHLAYRPMTAADLCRFLEQGAAVMDALAELEAAGTVGSRLIGNSLHYFDAVRPPAEPAVDAEADTTATVKQPRALPADQTVVPPVLTQVANASEKPYWAEEINVGGFSDGSFVIRKAGGRNEMTLSRAQMLRVVGFVNQFLAMEADCG